MRLLKITRYDTSNLFHSARQPKGLWHKSCLQLDNRNKTEEMLSVSRLEKLKLYQICYDPASSMNMQDGFDVLDNSSGPSEFREIVPIFRYLKTHELADESWFGFLSPKFTEKTGLNAADITAALREADSRVDAHLFTSTWSQIAFYKNVWEQGEYNHPGLSAVCQKLANRAGYQFDLLDSVSTLNNSVFSHFLVANGKFWKEWSRIVEIYFRMITEDDSLFQASTEHVSESLSIHPFVVERVPSLILQMGGMRGKFCQKIFEAKPLTEANHLYNPAYSFGRDMIANMPKLLLGADMQKERFLETGNRFHLDEYWRFRLWAPVSSGYTNMTETALKYINDNRLTANLAGLVKQDLPQLNAANSR